ncbi:CDP-diacylglycerol--serine O-phosphatidyltransferase [Halobacteriales archaeon SW_12_69_24]|nr:MAG: CDP-diacylglycerol--serine O-phosphatidyltransferase [Halobacteriales archaeon SW_12_69_24]
MDGLRVRERLGFADVVTLSNAAVGIVAAVVAFSAPALAARLLLLAAIADALDGITARTMGSSDVGPLLDAITDVVSFGATAVLGVATFFAVMSIVRTALYAKHFTEDHTRPGVQNTLAATILAAAYLAGLSWVPGLLVGTVVLSVAMVVPVPYPKLSARDAAVMGVVQFGAVLAPSALGRVLPRALLVAAFAYLLLAPRFYWER